MHTCYDRPVREHPWEFNCKMNFYGPTSLRLWNMLESLPIQHFTNKLNTHQFSSLSRILMDNWKVENYIISNPSNEEFLTQNKKELLDEC